MIQKITKKHFAVVAFAFAMLASVSGKAQIYWDFGTVSSLSAYPTSGIPSNISVDSVTKGNSTGTPFLSTTSVSSGYTGASGSVNAGTTAKIGALDYTVNATTGSAFYEITLTPATGYYVNVTGISFGSRSTGTGPKRYSIRTSLDGYATELAGDTITSASSTWGLRTQPVTIAGTAGTALKIRIYGYAGAGAVSAVNFRIDDLMINATAVGSGPDITTGPQDLTQCEGLASMFYITATGATAYQWQENTGTGFLPLTNAGIYSGVDNDTLMIADNTGLNGYVYRCVASNISGNDSSATATLNVNPTVAPTVSISGPVTTICENDSITGVAVGTNGGANPMYTWYAVGIPTPIGGDSLLVIPAGVITAGTYTVTCVLTSDAACASPATVTSNAVIITVNPLPASPIVSQAGNILSTSTYTSYQWYFEGAPLGTGSTQTATADGIYTVEVTNASGCSVMSADYNYVATGISSYSANEAMTVYPNPSKNGVFTYATDANKAVVTVYNIIGKQILNAEVTKGTHTLDLSAQANGSYFMSIKTDKEVITKKIIVSK